MALLPLCFHSPSYQTPSSPIPPASGDTPLAAARRDVVGLPRAAGDRLRALPELRPHRHRQRRLHLPHRVGALPLPPPPPPPELPETLTLTRRLVCSVACRWAGEAEPRVSFRNIVQRPRHRSSGETVTVVGDTDPALMKYFDCTRTSIRSAFDDDVVYQFEYMEYILDYAFDRLGATSEVGHPILMTECECNPSFSRARMSELLFETYGVPSV
uniref:Uncharacterized protein n=1 Tax=Aegilops tauschii subsp. strangulata TaxID=200361 RepID=A0A453DXR2_AEGTS